MYMCAKCTRGFAWVLLVLGVAFLGVDFRWWTFWGLNWWTVVFLVWAFAHFGRGHCPECQRGCACSTEEKPSKRKR